MKHKTIPQKIRRKVYEKYGGHCAYCGCKIDFKDMQVDHIDSVYRTACEVQRGEKSPESMEEINNITNYMPACRQCNFYKSTLTLEAFRKSLTATLLPNATKSFQFRLAEKYGLVQKTPHPIEFYFEKVEKQKRNS